MTRVITFWQIYVELCGLSLACKEGNGCVNISDPFIELKETWEWVTCTCTFSLVSLGAFLAFRISYPAVNQLCPDPPLRSSSAAAEACHLCCVCWHFQSEQCKVNQPALLLDKLQWQQVLAAWIGNSHLKTLAPLPAFSQARFCCAVLLTARSSSTQCWNEKGR